MQGIWSQAITLAVILQAAVVLGKPSAPQNQQAEEHLEPKAESSVAEKRIGYDYSAPHGLTSPYQDDLALHGEDRSSHEHFGSSHHHEDSYQGYWKKKIVWQPRWVKSWKEKKIYVSVWKKIWGPVIVKEWVPIPKPPPGWSKD